MRFLSFLTALATALFLCLSVPHFARAQATEVVQEDSFTSESPSARDREAAAEAYDRGVRDFLARQFDRAANWFETAYRLVPEPAALVQAMRAHERAGHGLRAATLALRIFDLHAGESPLIAEATTVLEANRAQLGEVRVVCDQRCALEVDGQLETHPHFFVDPSREHRVRASFEFGDREDLVNVAAGENANLRFEAPPAPPPPEDVPLPTSSGIHPGFAIAALALTAASGAVLTWSAIDMYDGVPAYQANPTPQRLADGQSREIRTDILIGVTAGLAASSVILLILTDWGGQTQPATVQPAQTNLRFEIVPNASGIFGSVSGQF